MAMPYRSSSQQYPTPPSDQSSRRPLRPKYLATDVTSTINPNVLTAVGTQWPDDSFNEQIFYEDPTFDINDPGLDLFSERVSDTSASGFGFLTGYEFSQPYNESEQPVNGFVDTAAPAYNQQLQYYAQPVSPSSYQLCHRQGLELTHGHHHHHQPQRSPSLSQAVPLSPSYSSNSSNATPMLTCDICGKETKRKKDMDRHKDTMHGNTEFICRVCDFIKKRKDRLHASCHTRHPAQAPRIEKILIGE